MRWIEIFIDFGVPVLFGVLGLCLILRGLGKWRRKSERKCSKCRYDMRATDGLECPECGYVASTQEEVRFGKPRRWLVGVGVILVLPVVFIAGFFAWHGPSVYYLRQHIQALENATNSVRWPQVTVRYVDWGRAPDYWTVPGADWLVRREKLDNFHLLNKPGRSSFFSNYDVEFNWMYFLNLAFTPGRHYGRYFQLEVPIHVRVSNLLGHESMNQRGGIQEVRRLNPTGSIQPITDSELASLLTPLRRFITELNFDIDRQAGFSGKTFDGLTGLRYAKVRSDDIGLVEWVCGRPGLKLLEVNYQGPSQDADRIASSILKDGHVLKQLSVHLSKPYRIDAQYARGFFALPNVESLYLSDMQMDVSALPEQLISPDGPMFKMRSLSLVNCSDEQLRSFKVRMNPWSYLFLDLNNSQVSDSGLDWLGSSSQGGLDLRNAPRVTLEKVGKLPSTFYRLFLDNVGLTDAALMAMTPAGLSSLGIEDCPVTDEGLIQFLKRAPNLSTLDLGKRTPSPDLVKQITVSALGRLKTVWMKDVQPETLDLFLSSKANGLSLIVKADWDQALTQEYIKKFKDAGMMLRVGSLADAPQ